jgi:hypothetical protein
VPRGGDGGGDVSSGVGSVMATVEEAATAAAEEATMVGRVGGVKRVHIYFYL